MENNVIMSHFHEKHGGILVILHIIRENMDADTKSRQKNSRIYKKTTLKLWIHMILKDYLDKYNVRK